MTTTNKQLVLPTNIDPKKIQIVMICEALPTDSLYVVNIIGAFKNAGIKINSIDDVTKKGVYLTTAIKEPRKGLTVPTKIIENYSALLEQELNMFPNIKAILLMGDTAIKAINVLARRVSKKRVIPAGSTYKIRGGKFYFGSIRLFPSYLPTGKNFLIEKAKREMVTEDIKNVFKLRHNSNNNTIQKL
jgi:uracil-DNA glycosylase